MKTMWREHHVPTKIGDKYGRLTVLALSSRGKSKKWLVICECGTLKNVQQRHLRNNHTASCGCLRKEMSAERFVTHGKTGSKIFETWSNMIHRCSNSKRPDYMNYGGRGITVNEEWKTFDIFYADMGDIPFSGAQIDRIDNNMGYSKDNCRWASRLENAKNTRRNTHLEHNGKKMIIAEWSRETGLRASRIIRRIQRGWSVNDAITKPLRGQPATATADLVSSAPAAGGSQ